MMWLVEEPVTILLLGGLTVAMLAYAWWQLRYRWLLHAWLGLAALTVGLLLLESVVETEPEQIEAALRQIARDVESNDLERILRHVYSGAPQTLAQARSEFPRYEFERVSIKQNIEISLDPTAQPPAARVTFNVRVDVVELSSRIRYTPARFVMVTMRKEGGAWKVAEYAHDDVLRGMQLERPR
jgi:hypothetical protein